MCHCVVDVAALGEKPNETVFSPTLGINAFYLADESRRSSQVAGHARRLRFGLRTTGGKAVWATLRRDAFAWPPRLATRRPRLARAT